MRTAAVALALCASPAVAAPTTLNLSQSFDVGGDLAFCDECRQPIYLPSFDPTLGTLLSIGIQVQGELDWGQPFISVASPGPLETISTFGSMSVFDDNGTVLGSEDITGPTSQVSSTNGLGGSFTFDASGALPLNDSSPYVNLSAIGYGICSSCEQLYVDDTSGNFGGTLITTFQYLPPGDPIPEPWSVALLGVGLLGLGIGRVARR